MKLANLTELRGLIFEIAKRSQVGERVQDVTVEADDYGEGTEYLRVQVQLENLENVRSNDVDPLVQSIEERVAEIDDRFPSVRFSEAA